VAVPCLQADVHPLDAVVLQPLQCWLQAGRCLVGKAVDLLFRVLVLAAAAAAAVAIGPDVGQPQVQALQQCCRGNSTLGRSTEP
jgi:hypothetical protein